MRHYPLLAAASAIALCAMPLAAAETTPGTDQAMGQQFHITPDSLPAPGATPSVNGSPEAVPRGTHQPIVPAGFTIKLLLDNVADPRRFLVAPDGLVYVAQQSAGSVIAIKGANVEGSIEPSGILQGAVNPYGLGLIPSGDHAGDLVLGDTDAIYRLPIKSGGEVAQLSPDGALGRGAGHITREVAIDPKSGDIYVGVGSMNNIADDEPPMKATIQKFAAAGGAPTTFATGMRNVTGMAFQPGTGDLYAVTMERDGMGDELVPDYLTRVQQGDNFGWPYQYIGGNAQPDYSGKGLKLAAAKVPDVLFAAHSAPLDLAFIPDSWPAQYRGDAIVALHGSWNAQTPRGYKLVIVHFKDGRPDGSYENFMTGFWIAGTSPAQVWGRPAAVAFDKDGALLVGDDQGGTIWRVTPPKE